MKLNKLVLLSAAFASGLTLVSCGAQQKSEETKSEVKSQEVQSEVKSEQQSEQAQEVKGYVGLGHVANYAYTAAVAATDTAAAKPHAGQIDATAAMVVFDKDGKVLENRIDVVQVKFTTTEDNDGLQLTNAVDGDIKTKLELGTNYNMVKFGHAVAEVDAQIESFADWTIGKTLAEIKAALNGTKLAEGTLATCTINVKDFVDAMEVAWALKDEEEVTLPESYSVGVNFKSGLYYSNNKEVTIDLGGVVVADGKVIAAQIDALDLQFVPAADSIAFNDNTKYVKKENDTVVDNAVSKKELGDAYAMKLSETVTHGSEREWYEHADIIEHLVVGKTAAQIAALTQEDFSAANATITVSAYIKTLSTAAAYAVLEHVGPQAEAQA